MYRALVKHSCTFTIVLLLAVGCISTESQQSVNMAKLLIDLSAMPNNWGVTFSGQPRDDFHQQAGANIQFAAISQELHVAAHQVFQYRSERQAAKEFDRLLPIQFNSLSITSRTSWQPPPELPYTSSVADQFYFACHISEIRQEVLVCQAMGQYTNYLVLFYTHVVSEYMTYTDIESILLIIDNLMADHLER